MIMTIPIKELESYHIDSNNLNVFDLLSGTNQYDNHITVVDVHFR